MSQNEFTGAIIYEGNGAAVWILLLPAVRSTLHHIHRISSIFWLFSESSSIWWAEESTIHVGLEAYYMLKNTADSTKKKEYKDTLSDMRRYESCPIMIHFADILMPQISCNILLYIQQHSLTSISVVLRTMPSISSQLCFKNALFVLFTSNQSNSCDAISSIKTFSMQYYDVIRMIGFCWMFYNQIFFKEWSIT